jgi:hypothetical protein
MRYRICTVLALFISVVMVLWAIDEIERSRVAPPRGRHSLKDFKGFIARPKALVKVPHGGSHVFVLFGEQQTWRFREWPPGYAFDEDGRLVVWAVEASDVQEHAALWRAARNEVRAGRLLTYDQAEEALAVRAR